MTHIVKKAFKTPNRKFAPGQEVTPADISGPVPFARWVELGHLEPKPADEPKAKRGKTDAA